MHPMTDIATVRRIALYVAIPALCVAVAMTFQFGRSMSFLHAICLGLLTIAGSIIWPYIKHIATDKIAANFFRAVGVVFLTVEMFSHLGYTVGTRVIESESTQVTNAVYQNNQESVKDNAANLQLWTKQLKDLTEQNAWAASVKADALRTQLETASKAIDNETKRGGCKSKCEAKMRERDAIAERIGKVEQVEDLTKRIDAAKRLADDSRQKANATEYKTSAVVAQTGFVAQLATQSLEPDKASMTWTTIAIGFVVSLVSTFLAPVMLTIALGPMRPSEFAERLAETVSGREDPKRDAKGNTVFNINSLDDKAKKQLSDYVSALTNNRRMYAGSAA